MPKSDSKGLVLNFQKKVEVEFKAANVINTTIKLQIQVNFHVMGNKTLANIHHSTYISIDYVAHQVITVVDYPITIIGYLLPWNIHISDDGSHFFHPDISTQSPSNPHVQLLSPYTAVNHNKQLQRSSHPLLPVFDTKSWNILCDLIIHFNKLVFIKMDRISCR